jgi:hypothetical protein
MRSSLLLHLRMALFGIAAAFIVTLVFVFPAFADDCLSDPLNAADCMRTGGSREIISIIFTTLPTISVIIPNLLQPPAQPGVTPGEEHPAQDQPPDEGEEPPDEIRYVVQVSAQSITLSPNQSQGFSLKAYKSVNKGPWQPAPEVNIGLSLSPQTSDVSLSPIAGSGEMQATVGAYEQAQPGRYQIVVTGISPNAQTRAQVDLEITSLTHDIQVSNQRLVISVGETLDLTVVPVRLGEAGVMEPDPDARLRPWLPSETGYFNWDPPGPYGTGQTELYGQVTFKITALKADKPEEVFYLDFTAIFPDKKEVDKRVEIVLRSADYVIEFL